MKRADAVTLAGFDVADVAVMSRRERTRATLRLLSRVLDERAVEIAHVSHELRSGVDALFDRLHEWEQFETSTDAAVEAFERVYLLWQANAYYDAILCRGQECTSQPS